MNMTNVLLIRSIFLLCQFMVVVVVVVVVDATKLTNVYSINGFDVTVDGIDITVVDSKGKIVWQTVPSVPFLRMGKFIYL